MKPVRTRGPSLWQRGLRAVSAATAAILVVGAGTALGATIAHAAPNAAISLIPLANASTPHGQFDPFNYVVDFSCSGSSGAGCANMEIRVPVTLEPRSGQVERFDRWDMTATLSNTNAASFTQRWETSGNTRTLVLQARNTINAGVQEALSLVISPATWVGDDVKFTVGGAQLTTSNGDPVTSGSHTATVTNIPLNAPTLVASSGYAESNTSLAQWVNYTFDPYINNIITQSGSTHVFGSGDVHTATTPNVTAKYETLEFSVEIPAGATMPYTTVGGQYQTQLNGRTLTFTIPANRMTTDAFRFSLRYPSEMAGQSVTLTANRTFVASNGDRFDDDATLSHRLDYRPTPVGELGKCGTGSTTVAASNLLGMCAASVVLPTEWTRQGTAANPASGSYSISMTKVQTGDTVTFTDFLPCFDTPGTSVLMDSFESAQVCANPALRITGLSATVTSETGNVTTPITSGVTFALTNNDGTITSPVTDASATFPSAPASGSWHGLSATVANAPSAGKVILTLDVATMPGVDREMLLENYASAEVVRGSTGDTATYETSPVGVIRVMDIIGATTRANISYTNGAAFATVSGSYAVDHLNPGEALPVYVMQLPAGFEPRYSDLSSFQVRYDGVGARYTLTDHFDVTVVPEDTAAGTGPRLLMTPRTGTAAIPTGGNGWTSAGVSGQITPTWGQWNTRQTLLTAVSLHGDANSIGTCTGGTTNRIADPLDIDGDGVTGADPTCEHTVSVMLGVPNQAATAVATKAVRDSGASEWVTGTTPAIIDSGSMEYLINWRNAGQPTLNDVVMYDLLPAPGDTGATTVTTGLSRGSTFQPVFTGLIGSVPAGMQVQFSASENPCRPEVLPANPGCENDWTADANDLGGNASVTAIRIALPSAQASGASHSLVFGMTVPTGATTNDVAWNTVAHRALLSGTPMNPAETANVGALIPSSVQVSKVLAPNDDGETEYSVKDVLSYTLEAHNESGAAANQVVLTDDLSDILAHATFNDDATATSGTVSFDALTNTLTWRGNLDPDERVTITYSVTATSVSTEAVVNRVVGTVGGEDTNCATGDETGCFAGGVINGIPAVTIDKTSTNVTEGTPVLSGSLVEWEYVVTNTGNEDLRISSLLDDRHVLVTCPARVLAVGDSMTCTGQGRVSGDPSYTNVGTVNAVGIESDRPVSDSDTWSTPIEQLSPALEVVKTAAGVQEGAELEPNQQVTWNYTVTNTGTDSFERITVTDDRGVLVSCPNPVNLEPGDSVTCTGTGTVGYAEEYVNVATATGIGHFTGETASDTDDWGATVRQQEVGLQIDKTAEGIAETDTLVKDTRVTWSYVVTNPGAEPIENIVVLDDQGVTVVCPSDQLDPGASMTCTGSGSIGDGDGYTNIGTATGTSSHSGRDVSAEDQWSVLIRDLVPRLSIEKGASNAVDGGSVLAGTTVHWNYTVQNIGEEAISNLVVTDDQGVEVTCPVTELAIGAITVCTGSATIGNVGSYTNVGTATGEGVETGTTTEDEDEWTTTVEVPTTGVVIMKNSLDFEYGSTVVRGSETSWEYEVVNVGSERLIGIVVTDDMGVEVSCPAAELAPGASMICTGSGSLGNGDSYTNVGSVTAIGEITGAETADDDTWTVGLTPAPGTGEPDDPTDGTWPEVPVGGEPGDPRVALVRTGAASIGMLGAAGFTLLALGVVLMVSRRRRVNG